MTDSFFFIPKSGSRLILPVEQQPQLPIQKQDQCLIIKKKLHERQQSYVKGVMEKDIQWSSTEIIFQSKIRRTLYFL